MKTIGKSLLSDPQKNRDLRFFYPTLERGNSIERELISEMGNQKFVVLHGNLFILKQEQQMIQQNARLSEIFWF